MKILTRKYFNLPADPWAKFQLPTADGRRVSDMVEAAVTAQAFVSILGARGSGKSHAIRTALAQYDDVRIVEPLRLDRDRLTMNDIASAIVRDLSDQTPKHGGEARAHQVRRVLGQASAPVVLVLDDAHALHGQTLRALKRLRELSWLSRSPLLGIMLVGQRDKTINIPEVGLRSDQLWLGGLTTKERKAALSYLSSIPAGHHSGRLAPIDGSSVIEADAADAIAAAPGARNWLDLQALVDACLLVAQAAGQRVVNKQHVALALDPSSTETMPTTNAPSDAQIGDYLAGKVATRRVANG